VELELKTGKEAPSSRRQRPVGSIIHYKSGKKVLNLRPRGMLKPLSVRAEPNQDDYLEPVAVRAARMRVPRRSNFLRSANDYLGSDFQRRMPYSNIWGR